MHGIGYPVRENFQISSVCCASKQSDVASRCVPGSDVDNIPCSESTCALKCVFGSGALMETERFVHRADVPARLKKKMSLSRAGPHGGRPLDS